MYFFKNKTFLNFFPFLIIFLSIVYIFFDILTLQAVYFGGDISYQNLPQATWAFKQIKKGFLPLWCPLLAGGFPLFAEGQTGILYPFNILFLYLPNYIAFHYLIIFHFFLASFFMYLFLREIKISLIPSTLASLGLILTYSRIFFITNLFYTFSYLPLIFYLVEKILKTKKKINFIIVFILVIGAQNFTSHFQASFVNLFALFLYLTGKSILAKHSKENILVFITTFLTLILLAVLVSLVQILPQQELVKLSIRAEKVPYSQAIKNSLNPKEIFKIFADKNNKSSLSSESKLTFLFFLVFLISGFFIKKDKKSFLYLALLLVNLILAFGNYIPLYNLLYNYVPLFNKLTSPSQFGSNVNFFLLVLFAMGLDKSLNYFKKNRYYIVIVLAIFIILFNFDKQNFNINYFPDDYLKLTTLDFKEYSKGKGGVILKTNPAIYQQTPEFIKYLKRDKDYYRVIGWGGFLRPNINLFFEMPLVVGYSPLTLKKQKDLFIRPFKRVEDLTNGKYVIIPKIFPKSIIFNIDENLKLIYDKEVKIYKKLNVFKRIFFVPYFQVYNNSLEILKEVQYGNINLKKIVLLEELPKTKKINHMSIVGKEEIKIIKNYPNEILIKANLNKSGFIVLSDTYYPGWSAYLDGIKKEIYCADYNFRAVMVEAGKHKIKFIYKPFSFYFGLLVSSLTLLFLTFVLVIAKILQRY